MIFGFGEHDAVEQNAGYLHLAGVERIRRCNALDLRYYEAARIFSRHGSSEIIQRESLTLHGDVTIGIASRPPDECDVGGERFVAQPFLAIDFHELDEILGRHAVDLAALIARIDEGAQSYLRNGPRAAGGDLAIEMRNATQREIVCFNLVVHGEFAEFGDQTPMAADHTLEEALVREAIEAALLAVTGRRRKHQCEI